MADPDFEIRGRGGGGVGGGHPDPEIRGRTRCPKKFFRSFGPHFGRKISGGGGGRAPRAPPLDPPVVLSFFRVFCPVLCSQNFLS